MSKNLYRKAKRGEWEEVVKEYEENAEKAQNLKLAPHDDTALHLAVSDNKEETVEKIVNLICSTKNGDYKQLLEITNDRENNPLHLAAFMGSVRMCHVIATAHPGLVDKRNIVDETPMFLAAVYGNTKAFFCLYSICLKNDASRITSNCRVKDNGDTVLHSALRNEHFDLAFQLIHINKEAKDWVNEDGITPLHVLASKPTSFKSGARITGWKNILYHCIFVDELKTQSIESLAEACKACMSKQDTATSYFPDNYKTCIFFITRLWDGFLKVTTLKRLFNEKKNDHTNVAKESKECSDTRPPEADRLANEASIPNLPVNYITCIDFFQIVLSNIWIFLGFGSGIIRKMRKKKEKHTWSVQVMEKLFGSAGPETYSNDGKTPIRSNVEPGVTSPYNYVDGEAQFSDDAFETESTPKEPEKPRDVQATETAILSAAKNGVIEIVKGMFERFPLAICDTRKDKKNVVLLAAEYRQPDVYKFLLTTKPCKESLFRAIDDKGNSVLHLAAAAPKSMLWRISGTTMQLQWEVKWYKFIEESMPLHFFAHYNKEGKNASTIFHETHMDMVKKSGDWLTKTSKSGSVVGALVVTVAYASAASIPGGFDPKDGTPLLKTEQAFFIYAVFSLIALCLSSTSVTMFLAILTHRFDASDFRSNLPGRLLFAFSSLFFSIISMLVSFCAGHYFLIHDRLRKGTDLLYMLIFVPVALIFLVCKLPLYIDLLQAIFIRVPSRSANVVLFDPIAAPNPSKPIQRGNFEVSSISVGVDSKPLSIFTPTTEGLYHVVFFLPGCLQSVYYPDFLQLIASHGCIIVAPQLNVMPTRSKTNRRESATTTQVKDWLASDREMVEAKLSKLPDVKQRKIKLSLITSEDRPTNPFSAVIGSISFDPMPGTKLSIPESQIQTQFQDPQSSNVSSPNVESQFVITKLRGIVKLLESDEFL